MDALVRGRRLLLIAVACAGPVSACGAKQGGEPVGVSTAGHGVAASGSRDGGAHGDAGVPADFRAIFPRANKARFPSNGHAAGRYDVDVYANAPTHGAVGTELPVGARFVEEHFERLADGGAAKGPIMMLEKMPKGFDPVHGDVRYVVITASGEVVIDGPAESCAGCHDDAPRDHVFDVP